MSFMEFYILFEDEHKKSWLVHPFDEELLYKKTNWGYRALRSQPELFTTIFAKYKNFNGRECHGFLNKMG